MIINLVTIGESKMSSETIVHLVEIKNLDVLVEAVQNLTKTINGIGIAICIIMVVYTIIDNQ